MTPEWKDAFRFAASLARDAGLELAIAASPGWSRNRRPVGPARGRDEEARLERDRRARRPALHRCSSRRRPTATGPFQSIAMVDGGERRAMAHRGGARPTMPTWRCWRFQLPKPAPPRHAAVTSGTAGPRCDGAHAAATAERALTSSRGTRRSPPALTFAYAAPQTVRSATLYMPAHRVRCSADPAYRRSLEASEDGRLAADCGDAAERGADDRELRAGHGAPVPRRASTRTRAAACPLRRRARRRHRPFLSAAGSACAGRRITELRLSGERVDHAETKAGFASRTTTTRLKAGADAARGRRAGRGGRSHLASRSPTARSTGRRRRVAGGCCGSAIR